MNDQRQREQALDITQSYIVQAPAGSGKTELLTQRYLKLLSVCEQPENIMAMTFTNKAVDELSERILLALKSTQKSRPIAKHKQITYDLANQVIARSNERDWRLLQNPKRLKISTIDGLSSLIVSRYPSDFQLVPYQLMAEQWARDKAYKHAAMQTLLLIDDAQHGKAISALLLYLDNHVDKFYRLTMYMLAKRDQWLTRLYRDDVLDADVLQQSARPIVEQHLQHLQDIAKQHLSSRFFELLQVNTQSCYAQIKSMPGATIQDLESWINLANLLLKGGVKKEKKWRENVNKRNGFPSELKQKKREFIDFLLALKGQEAFKDLLFEVLSLPDVDFSQAQVEVLTTIASVLKLCVAQLNLHFEDKQAHDFIQVALNANQILDTKTGVSDIALCLDYQLQHLLVDEFQDTSTSQFNSIEKLIAQWQVNDGKTLFLVGDPMQSIYRFRESQVGLFLQVKAYGIANIKPDSLVLSTNFRSSKSIVQGNNKFFQQLFPTDEDIYQGAIAYSPSQAASSAINRQAITVHPFADGQQQLEAQSVLKIIQTSLANNSEGEVAILVRNRSHLDSIIPLLKQHNIAFESLKTTPLKNHLLIRDLLSLTKALMHLGDRLAWLSVLRAPWCGLMLNDLLVLAESQEQIIYQQLIDESVLSKLSEDGQIRARHLRHCLQDVFDHQGRFSFVELLTYGLQQLGITASLLPVEAMIKDQFLQIIYTCEQQQLLNIETIKAALGDLYAPSETARVKLMTIHQSKGLEFDTVIIPGLGRVPANDKPPIMYIKPFADESLLLAPIKSSTQIDESNTYRYLKFIESKQNQFETMRLLYVAMTRAKQHLHLMGAVNQSQKAPKKSLLALLMPLYQDKFQQCLNAEAQTQTFQTQQTVPTLQRFKNLQTPNRKSASQGAMVAYQQQSERASKSALGSLVHQYFEQSLFNPSTDNIDARLIEIGTPPDAIGYWRNFIVRLLNNTKQDTQFNWLFKDRASTLTETEFISDGHIIVVDRLFIDENILWVIDFKTATPAENESLNEFISRQQSEHTKQLSFYQETLSQIYHRDIRCALYCPAVSQLIYL